MVSHGNTIFFGRRRSRKFLPGAKSVKKMYIVTPIMGNFWLQIALVNELSFLYEERYRSEFLFIAHGLRENHLFAKNARFEPFPWISEGPSGSFARFDAFSGPYPLLEGDPMR